MNWPEASNERSYREGEERDAWRKLIADSSDEELRRRFEEEDWHWHWQRVIVVLEYGRRFGEKA
jgi:hypothetical protein